jgi:trans-2-enoyl-CoA reductase
VTQVKKGDWIRSFSGAGTWRQHLVLKASDCLVLPQGLTEDQAAMIYVNPVTAWRMLHDFVSLQPGEWVVQNAGNSAVGRCIIQVARALGLKTYNLVRRPELIDELKALGADIVETEEQFDRKASSALLNGKKARLALNAVGGASALNLANLLGKGGIHVTYGAMSKMPLKIPNGLLIFNDLAFRGFWLTAWGKNASLPEQSETLRHLGDLMKQGKLQIPVASRYPLAQVREAVLHAEKEQRGGKIILDLK